MYEFSRRKLQVHSLDCANKCSMNECDAMGFLCGPDKQNQRLEVDQYYTSGFECVFLCEQSSAPYNMHRQTGTPWLQSSLRQWMAYKGNVRRYFLYRFHWTEGGNLRTPHIRCTFLSIASVCCCTQSRYLDFPIELGALFPEKIN